MDLEKSWEKALRHTEIVRPRIQPLSTFEATEIPYILLSESLRDSGGTVVRKGNVVVDRPSLLLPSNYPQLEGFEFDEEKRAEADAFMSFLLVRGIRFPSLLYNHQTLALSLYDGRLSEAAEYYRKLLQNEENVRSGLVIGPEDCWQFSVLVFTAGQVLRSAETDLERLLEQYRKKKDSSHE